MHSKDGLEVLPQYLWRRATRTVSKLVVVGNIGVGRSRRYVTRLFSWRGFHLIDNHFCRQKLRLNFPNGIEMLFKFLF